MAEPDRGRARGRQSQAPGAGPRSGPRSGGAGAMAGAGASAGPGASAGGAGMRSLAMRSHHPPPPGMVFPQIMGSMPRPGMGYHQPQQQQHPAPPPPSPPAFFPGSASLFEQLDKRVMVVLRDGRHLVGVMRSYDQFSNIVLEDTHERHFVGGMFGDIALGLYLVRGDALVLMGELDETLEETPNLRRVSASEIMEAQQEAASEDRQDTKLDWLFHDVS